MNAMSDTLNISYSEYKNGAIIGVSQTILGHPLDTLKIWKQTGNNVSCSSYVINPYNSNNGLHKSILSYRELHVLFRGISYPLVLSIGYNSFLFGFYTTLRNREFSSFQAGILSGACLGLVLNPFEYYKIQRQIGNTNKLANSSFCGLHYTLSRESLACGLYFTSYEYLSDRIGIGSFISGGLAGCTSWLLTYPIYTVKTRFQISPKEGGIYHFMKGGIFKGISFCLLRAFIVNGVSFSLYEFLR